MPASAPEKPWVILATDRRELGQPMRAVSKHKGQLTPKARLARRFATSQDAEAYLAWSVARKDKWTFTVTTL